MVYGQCVILPRRRDTRTYVLGPGSLPCIGYLPKRLIAAPSRNGSASRVGRKFHKVVCDNLGLVWYWPQWHHATAKKRFEFLKSKYRFDFIRLYKSEHSLLGMLTQSSWDLLCRALLSKTKPRTKRRRPDINSPDPNDVRGAMNHQSRGLALKAKKRRNMRRRGFQRSNRRDKRRAVLFTPGSIPDPRSVSDRSDFSREMERNEILRRRDAEFSTSQSGVPTTRQASVVSVPVPPPPPGPPPPPPPPPPKAPTADAAVRRKKFVDDHASRMQEKDHEFFCDICYRAKLERGEEFPQENLSSDYAPLKANFGL